MTKLLFLNICVEQSQPTCTLKSMGGMQPTSASPRGCEQELVVIGIFSLVSRYRSLDHCHSQIRQLFNSLKTFSDPRVSSQNDGLLQLPCHFSRFSIVVIPLPHLHNPGVVYLEADGSDFGISYRDRCAVTHFQRSFPHQHSDSLLPDSHGQSEGLCSFLAHRR